MNVDRILGVIGVVISLPGFFLLFFSDKVTLGAMAVLLGFVILAAAWLYWYLSNLPPFTLKSAEVRLEFLDSKAHLARMTKVYEIRPNHSHLTTLTHRNIAADGAIENVCWNDSPVPFGQIEDIMGELKVTVSIGIRPKWKTFTGKLSYDLRDSFPKRTEGIYYVPDFPTKVAWITIQMPPGKRCGRARATKIQGAGEVAYRSPSVADSGAEITLTLTKPSLGSEYAIYWDW